jgi:integrase
VAPQRLTNIAIDQLKPAATRREIPDTAARGLYVIVQPSGRRRFCVRYRHGGKSRKLTLAAGLSLADARLAAAAALRDVERGHDPAVAKRDAKAAAELAAANTLRAVAEAYLAREEHKPLGKRLRTIDQRRATFTRLIYPKLAHRPIAEIRRSEVVALLDHVEAERGGRMADEVLGCLRIVFDWHALRDDTFRTPLVRGMTITKPADRIRIRVLSDDEVRRLWRAADEMGPPFGAFTQFILLTATRRNEAAQMTRGEVKDGDWLISAARYKNKHDHMVPLSKAAQALLAKLPVFVGCDYYFTGDGQHAIAGFSSAKAKLDKLSGVSGYRLHDLRRTSRSLMSAAGINPDHAERCLGHALPGLRKTYDQHEFYSEKKAAFELLAAYIARVVDPPEGNVVRLRHV